MTKYFLLLILAASAVAQNTPLASRPGDVWSGPRTDGPSELPRAGVTIPETPSTGTKVPAGGLQKAVTAAKCGDTLLLDPTVTYTLGVYVPKNCAAKYLTIRSAAPDSALPAPGVRITPCYAGISGIASVVGRPAFQCPLMKRVVPLIILTGAARLGGSYTHFMGVEITTLQSSTAFASGMVVASNQNHVILDRVLLHGAPNAEIQRGLAVGGAKYVALVDSYLYDFKCTKTCSDSQAVFGGVGAGGGPILIDNNFLEAGTENILLGGGGATATQCDITIRNNHLFKPLEWMTTNVHVKNLIELKNACRVLIEGNEGENSWGGFSQAGYTVLVTPKNQNGNAPGALVDDVTIRWSRFTGGSGFQIAAARDTPVAPATIGPSSLGMKNLSIHDAAILLDNVAFPVTGTRASSGIGMQLTLQDPSPTANFTGIALDHVSVPAVSNSAFMFGGSKAGTLSITNSLFAAGKYGSTSNSSKPGDCSANLNGKAAQALTACWTSVMLFNNALLGSAGVWPSSGFQTGQAPPAGQSVGVDSMVLDSILKGVQ